MGKKFWKAGNKAIGIAALVVILFLAIAIFYSFNAKGTAQTHKSNASTTITSIIPASTMIPANSFDYGFNYFNLTGSGYINNSTGKLEYFSTVNKVNNVTIRINRTVAAPGDHVLLNITFYGNFTFNTGNSASSYYLNSTVVNTHYFGAELQNQSGSLFDQNNGPWYNYFSIIQIGTPYKYPSENQNTTLSFHWIITPVSNATNETIKLCGGYFAALRNATAYGGWINAYDNLSMKQELVSNSTIISIPSQSCEYLNVI